MTRALHCFAAHAGKKTKLQKDTRRASQRQINRL
jgi:hypothetical protein